MKCTCGSEEFYTDAVIRDLKGTFDENGMFAPSNEEAKKKMSVMPQFTNIRCAQCGKKISLHESSCVTKAVSSVSISDEDIERIATKLAEVEKPKTKSTRKSTKKTKKEEKDTPQPKPEEATSTAKAPGVDQQVPPVQPQTTMEAQPTQPIAQGMPVPPPIESQPQMQPQGQPQVNPQVSVENGNYAPAMNPNGQGMPYPDPNVQNMNYAPGMPNGQNINYAPNMNPNGQGYVDPNVQGGYVPQGQNFNTGYPQQGAMTYDGQAPQGGTQIF